MIRNTNIQDGNDATAWQRLKYAVSGAWDWITHTPWAAFFGMFAAPLLFAWLFFWASGGSSIVRWGVARWFPISKSKFEVDKALAGENSALINSIIGTVTENQITASYTVIYALITLSLSLIAYNKSLSLLTNRQLKAVEFRNDDLARHVSQIQNHLDDPNSHEEKLAIGVFSRLLAYTPLYVADQLGYFKDEGLSLEIVSAGGDELVANGIRGSKFSFGICDPIFSMQKNESVGDDLKILMPVAKRLDLMVACKKSTVFKSSTLRILSYPQPSTTFAAALALSTQLKRHPAIENVEIIEKSPEEEIFQSPQNIDDLIEEADIFLLWNPHSAWLTQQVESANLDIGQLVRNKKISSMRDSQHWEILNFDEYMDTDKYALWQPYNDQKEQHKLLASALMVSQSTLDNRPKLCHRVFKAMSRALVRIEGINWEIEQKQNPNIGEIINSNLDDPDYVDNSMVASLVRHPNFPESPSLFPFIEGTKSYKRSTYRPHLRNLYKIWKSDEKFSPNLISELRSAKNFDRFFANLDRK